jgi:hypothetical protein
MSLPTTSNGSPIRPRVRSAMTAGAILQGMLTTIAVTEAQVTEASRRVDTARNDIRTFYRQLASLKAKLESQLREIALIEIHDTNAVRDHVTDTEIAHDLNVCIKTISRISKKDPTFPRSYRYRNHGPNRRKRHEYEAWKRCRELATTI